ncbi:MAG: porin family protein [Prevotella sp.]|nr:porin family protein [Prevotella sp.]
MKKIFMLLAMIVTMTAANNASAQIKFGLKGGVNVTDMSLNSSVFDASNRTGFFVGPTIKVQLPLVGLGIDASALYDQREAKIKVGNTTTKETLRSQAINVPINLRYGWGLSSMANIFLFAGPQFGFNVGDKDQKITESSTWSVKNSNFSLNFGAGVTLLSHLQLTANYNVVCGKTSDASIEQLTNKEVRSRANAWQIALAYYF